MEFLDLNLICDLPSGPLDSYRKLASFNWKLMKLFIETPMSHSIKIHFWEIMESDPVFRRDFDEICTEESKKIANIRLLKFLNFDFMTPSLLNTSYKDMGKYLVTVNDALGAAFPDLSIKFSIGVLSFINILLTLGTERHQHILDATLKGKIVACLAITEIAHGSDVGRLQTTAAYDKTTQEFIINTPNFKATKCWIGNLAKTCTIALLFAQLYIDEQCYGIHIFIVPIRDPETFLPFPGIVVGDIGEKIGLHGLDNGYIMFRKYRIPREYLVNRFADVSVEGEYTNSNLGTEKMLPISLLNLSAGRLVVMQICLNNCLNAVTIAIRYAALRKQFFSKPDDKEEVSLLEYQLHQHRLFPYVAAALVLKFFLVNFTELYFTEVERSFDTSVDMGNVVTEIHAIISSAKPLISRISFNAIQECREACGGHGFLKSGGFGELRECTDACLTFEGDNNVLGQQTSNWLLKQWEKVYNQRGKVDSPLGTCEFLNRHQEILEKRNMKFVEEHFLHPDFVKTSLEWLLTYLLQKTHCKREKLSEKGLSMTEIKNTTQVYEAVIITEAYGRYIALNYFWQNLLTADSSLQTVLKQLGTLYGLSCIANHSSYFYQGGYITDGNFLNFLQEAILKLCAALKNDMVAVVDAIGPPDFVLNSLLGKSDGKLYENIENAVLSKYTTGSRPDWWKDVIIPDAPNLSKIKSKL